MKLLLCLKCSDIFSLRMEERLCVCGLTKGKYIDNLNAEVSGPCMPIGFANDSFIRSLRMQRAENKYQKEPTCCQGVDFEAFFIHNCASSVKRTDKLENHIQSDKEQQAEMKNFIETFAPIIKKKGK